MLGQEDRAMPLMRSLKRSFKIGNKKESTAYYLMVPEELEEAIRVSIKNGATGICLFTPDRMTEEHWAVFERVVRQQ